MRLSILIRSENSHEIKRVIGQVVGYQLQPDTLSLLNGLGISSQVTRLMHVEFEFAVTTRPLLNELGLNLSTITRLIP